MVRMLPSVAVIIKFALLAIVFFTENLSVASCLTFLSSKLIFLILFFVNVL